MTVEILGREKELRSIQAFFERTSGEPAALRRTGLPLGTVASSVWFQLDALVGTPKAAGRVVL
jgi:hypothetical protein